MSGVSDDYKREKLKSWCPHWNPETIDSWHSTQLEQIYRRIQREIVTNLPELS